MQTSYLEQRRFSFLPSILLAGVAAVYLAVIYPYQFHFQEQFQLFLWNGDYAREVMSVPGGVADYIGRFFTQFYYIHGLGPVILAICFGLAHFLLIQNMPNKQPAFRFLAVLPVVFLWIYLQNVHALLGTGMAYMIALAAAWAINQIKQPWLHGVVSVVSIPLLYAGIGAMVWLFTIAICAQKKGRSLRMQGAFILFLLLISLCLPWVASLCCPYQVDALISGIHYYRFPADHPFLIWFIIGISALTTVIPDFPIRKKLFRTALPIASLAIGAWLLFTQTRPATDETLAYSYWGRTRQWDSIIKQADQNSPKTVVGVCMLNLALGMEGELNAKMQNYFQNGAGGLIPAVQNDFLLSPVAGEVYYQLGMTYMAQQQMMEAMEALPDMQKSAYIYQRLAETNLINGAYGVAYKYLKALQQTLFYCEWATETLKLLGDEEAINRHPEYGKLRRMAFTENRFSMGTLLERLHELCSQRPENKLAADYLKACLRLTMGE